MHAASRPWCFVGFDDQNETVCGIDRSEQLPASDSAIGGGCEVEDDALADESFRRAVVAIWLRAGDRARSGDLDFGKVALCQLSYSRAPGHSIRLSPPIARNRIRAR